MAQIEEVINSRTTKWVFTINNYTDEDCRRLVLLPRQVIGTQAERRAIQNISVLIAEREVGQEGTPHIQGYIEFQEKVYRRVVEGILGGRAWLDIARGSRVQNVRYCTKDSREDPTKLITTYYKNHIQQEQTEHQIRNFLRRDPNEHAREILNNIKNLSLIQLEEEEPNFFLRNLSKIHELRHEFRKNKGVTFQGELQDKNFWIYGPTGTGKSRFARGNLPPDQIFSKPVNKWWNGYDEQPRVIIDDWPSLEFGGCLVQHMKIWSDRYPFTAEIKNAHEYISPTYTLIVTSNFRIEECFKDPADVEALKRRFKELPFNGEEDANRYQSIEHLMQRFDDLPQE